MSILRLLTDGSADPGTKIGYGAYLVVPELVSTLDGMHSQINLKQFENTSSTRLELQTLLWALNDIEISVKKIIVYTDCQNLLGLRGRRDRFEESNYTSKKNRRLANADLYQQFFQITDQIDCEIIKVSGHKPPGQKDEIDWLFSLVDKAARKALREYCG